MRAALAIVLLAAALPLRADALVLRRARVYPVSREVLPQADLLIVDGVIRQIAERVEPPEGAEVVSLRDKSVTPGLIDCASHLGVYYERDDTIEAVTPDFSILDAFAPTKAALREALTAGVTTVMLTPGDQNPVGGTLAVVKLGASTANCRVVNPKAGLAVSLSDAALLPLRAPTSRPELEDTLRRALRDAAPGSAMAQAAAGELPVWITCEQSDEVETALRLAEEFGLQMRLVGLREAHRSAASLAAADTPVVLPTFQVLGGAVELDGVAALTRAGVKLAFATWAPYARGEDLRTTASVAIRHGLPREAALRALTLGAAEILGVADRVGSLEVGKQADLVVFSGDPLDLTSRVELVIVEGRIVHGEARP